jgi:hypothetical protein
MKLRAVGGDGDATSERPNDIGRHDVLHQGYQVSLPSSAGVAEARRAVGDGVPVSICPRGP